MSITPTLMDGSGYSGDSNSNLTTFEPFTTADIRIPSTSNIDDYQSCRVWTPERVFLQIFLIAVLICNMFTCYVIITATKKKGNSFVSHCMLITNFSGMALALLLLLYPFAFKWTSMLNSEVISTTTITYNDDIQDIPYFQPILSNKGVEEGQPKPVHTCQQAGTLPCRTSGLMFGVFMYSPLVATCVMMIDFIMAAFSWKMYRFRPHTVSAIRLTLLISNLFAVISISTLPAIGLGTHFHYYKLLKVCWLSDAFEVNTVHGFTFFIYGYTGSLVLVIACCTSIILKASTATNLPYRGMSGSCSIICGSVIMKSRSWKSYSQLVISVGVLTVLTYLPITFGNVIRFSMFRHHYYYWFEVTSQLLTLVLPSLNPFLYILLFEPHRQRADEILNDWKGGPKLRSSSTSSSISSSEEDQDYRRQAWGNSNYNYHNYQIQQTQKHNNIHGNIYPRDDDREPYYTKSVHRVNPLYDNENYPHHPKVYNPDSYDSYNHPIRSSTRQNTLKDLMLKQARKLTPSNLRRAEHRDNPDSAYSTFKKKNEKPEVKVSKRSVSFVENPQYRNDRNTTHHANQSTSHTHSNRRRPQLDNLRNDSNLDSDNRQRYQNRDSERIYDRPSYNYETSENHRDFDGNHRQQTRGNRHYIPPAYRNELYNNIAEFMNQQKERNRHRHDYKD